MLFGPLLEGCGKKNYREAQQRIHCSGRLWFPTSLTTDFRLTSHLLDPTEGSEVARGGRLLKQLEEDREEETSTEKREKRNKVS